MAETLKPKRRGKVRHGLSLAEEDRLKLRLLVTACSAAWVDAQFFSLYEQVDGDAVVVTRFHDPRIYPPEADTTPMIRCVRCGVATPAPCIDRAHRVCLDCQCGERPEAQDVWGPSPWHTAMERVRLTNARVVEMALAHRARVKGR